MKFIGIKWNILFIGKTVRTVEITLDAFTVSFKACCGQDIIIITLLKLVSANRTRGMKKEVSLAAVKKRFIWL